MSSFRKHSILASIAVFGSRLAGLVREVIFAFLFGAQPALDAFITAFRIPNLLLDLFAEGALSQAFVTVFSQKMQTENDAKAWDLANRIFGVLILVLTIFVALGIIFSPFIVSGIATGFEGEKLQLTILLNRILFPFILVVSMAALAMGMLNARGRFGLPQSASTFFNISSIITGVGLAYCFAPHFIGGMAKYLFGMSSKPVVTWEEARLAIVGMACGALIGGFVQWFVLMPSLKKMGFHFHPSLDWKNPDVKKVFKLMVPAIIGGAAVQINVLINTNFASFLSDGSISWLNYAFRLMQFPLGLFGVSVALAMTPAYSREHAKNDDDAKNKILSDSIRMIIYLCVPATLGLILFAKPIMALIYQYGQFSAFDTEQSAYALQAYAVGLTFYSLIKVYQPAFLALGRAKILMGVSLFSIASNIILNSFFVFYFHLGHWGLALGTSIVAGINWILLARKYRHVTLVSSKGMFSFLFKVFFSASFAIGGIYFLLNDFITRAPMVLFPIVFAGVIYILITMKLNIEEALLLKKFILRKKAGLFQK